MTDMLFEQPIELLADEQLVRLPIEDLLNACRSSPEFSEVCKRREIWIARIQNEYPEVLTFNISNPREFYLRQKLFGGGIYIHTVDYSSVAQQPAETQRITPLRYLDAQTQQVAPEIIEYNNLFVRTKEIAEGLRPVDKDYIIVYSHQRTDNKPGLSIVGYQVSDYTVLAPGPSEKITLVDILYVLPNSPIIWEVRSIEEFNTALNSNQPNVEVNGRRYRLRDIPRRIEQIFHSLSSVDISLLKYHELANTAFYRREVDYLRGKLLLASETPKVTRLSDINTDMSKGDLLNFIISNFPQLNFRTASQADPVLGFATYADFALFQTNYVNEMDDDQVRTLGVLMRGLLPIMKSKTYDNMKKNSAFVFDSDGEIVLI